MKQKYLFLLFLMVGMTACSEHDFDTTRWSDKGIAFEVSVDNGTGNEATTRAVTELNKENLSGGGRNRI